VRRREFIGALGAVVVLPHALHAQPTESTRRVGILMAISDSDPDAQARAKAFEHGLQQVGWGKEKGCFRPDHAIAEAQSLISSPSQAQISATT
jgi:hypothetical protein